MIRGIEDIFADKRNTLNPEIRNRLLNVAQPGSEFSVRNGVPGLHAEVQSANSLLNELSRLSQSVDISDIQISTFKLQNSVGQGVDFPACPNCGGLLNGFDIITGRRRVC